MNDTSSAMPHRRLPPLSGERGPCKETVPRAPIQSRKPDLPDPEPPDRALLRDLKDAQSVALKDTWDNEDDELWNDVGDPMGTATE